MSNPTIPFMIRDAALPAGKIASAFPVYWPAVSRDLRLLREANHVREESHRHPEEVRMSTPQPSGRLVGNDLQLVRRFRAPIEDVWRSLTDSASTARWFGPWRWVDQPGPGNQIAFTMIQEEGAPESTATVERCEPPRHLAIRGDGPYGVAYEITLAESQGTTTLTFVHHLADRSMAGDFGPGWEFYLDLLVDAREGRPLRKFGDYYPAQKAYYLDLIPGS